jgi:outer membrane protein assembly factor BamD (BamD/ComL family)
MRKNLLILFIAALLAGCSNPKKDLTTKVKDLEKQVTDKYDPAKAKELIESYNTYIEKYPTDSTSRLFMAKGCEMSFRNNDPENALKFINEFLKTFPDDKRAPLMQFKKAIVYDLLLHDNLRAVAEYEKFIQKYPNDPMRVEAENAVLLIKNPETFMATFKDQTDSNAVINESQ